VQGNWAWPEGGSQGQRQGFFAQPQAVVAEAAMLEGAAKAGGEFISSCERRDPLDRTAWQRWISERSGSAVSAVTEETVCSEEHETSSAARDEATCRKSGMSSLDTFDYQASPRIFMPLEDAFRIWKLCKAVAGYFQADAGADPASGTALEEAHLSWSQLDIDFRWPHVGGICVLIAVGQNSHAEVSETDMKDAEALLKAGKGFNLQLCSVTSTSASEHQRDRPANWGER